MKRTFYKSGAQLPTEGYGQPEGMQAITAVRRKGIVNCPKDGCPKYEKGYSIVVDMNSDADRNVARFVREGKIGRFAEELLEHGLIRFHFPPGQCSGHRITWDDELPVYFVGQTAAGHKRKTNHDEYQERFHDGSHALIKTTQRKKEMTEG
jgi:hypothetical protein